MLLESLRPTRHLLTRTLADIPIGAPEYRQTDRVVQEIDGPGRDPDRRSDPLSSEGSFRTGARHKTWRRVDMERQGSILHEANGVRQSAVAPKSGYRRIADIRCTSASCQFPTFSTFGAQCSGPTAEQIEAKYLAGSRLEGRQRQWSGRSGSAPGGASLQSGFGAETLWRVLGVPG